MQILTRICVDLVHSAHDSQFFLLQGNPFTVPSTPTHHIYAARVWSQQLLWAANLTSVQLKAAFAQADGIQCGLSQGFFLMNFLCSYGQSCSAQQNSGCLNESKTRFVTESASVCVGKRWRKTLQILSLQVFFFFFFLTKQINAKYFLCTVLHTPSLYFLPPLCDCRNHYFLWQLFGAFSHILADSWLCLWLPLGIVSIKTLLWSLIKAGFSWVASFLFVFENRQFPKSPAALLHIH